MSKSVWSDGGNFLAVTVGTEREEGEPGGAGGELQRGGWLGGELQRGGRLGGELQRGGRLGGELQWGGRPGGGLQFDCQAVGFVLDNLSGGLCLDNCCSSQQAAHSAADASRLVGTREEWKFTALSGQLCPLISSFSLWRGFIFVVFTLFSGRRGSVSLPPHPPHAALY